MESQKQTIVLDQKQNHSLIFSKSIRQKQQITCLSVSQKYGDWEQTDNIIKKLREQIKQNKCQELYWSWADSLTVDHLNILINQILPSCMISIYLDGCMHIQNSIFQNLVKKFSKLQHINFYCQRNQDWDLQIHIQGRSMKNYRQRSKWSSKISLNNKSLMSMPSTLVTLSLKNIKLGNLTNAMKIIASQYKSLAKLDISNTQLTDDNFVQLNQNEIQQFLTKLESLNIGCNRISKLGLCKFLKINTNCPPSKNTVRNNLKQLNINETNVNQIYPWLFSSFPSLQKLGLQTLTITDQQIDKVLEQSNNGKHVWKELRQLNLGMHIISMKNINRILESTPSLQSLNLSNLEITTTVQNNSNVLKFPLSIKNIDLSSSKMPNPDSQVNALLENCKQLQIVKLSNTKISGNILMKLGSISSKIKWLEISYLDELDLGRQSIIQAFDISQKQLQLSWDKILCLIMRKLLINLSYLEYFEGYGMFLNAKQSKITTILSELHPKQSQAFKFLQVMVDHQGLIDVKIRKNK